MNHIPHPAPRRAPPHSAAFMQVFSGACVDLMAPDLTAVSLTDFATALSRLPRFLGATRHGRPYSVAQHSVLVMQIIERGRHTTLLQRAALLHDAHEALMGDIPTPVKIALGRASVQELEGRLQSAMGARFGLSPLLFHHWSIQAADQVALLTERRDLLAPSAWPWPESPHEPLADTILQPWPESLAHVNWLRAAAQLGLR